ncbi:MAG: hypothetical protein WCD11_11630, partial [Solirubrobacteraceae bacterium]
PRPSPRSPPSRTAERRSIGRTRRWACPALELLERPTWSRARTIGMYALRGYLVIAVLMLIVKAIEVGIGH